MSSKIKNNYTVKKITALILAVIGIVSIASPAFANDVSRRSALIKAKPVSVGFEALVDEFTVTKSSGGMKYAYYNPVIDDKDDTKYPVVIYIHGLFHGWTDRTFRKSGLTYWASREMQNKFEEGGAHLIMPKIPEFYVTALQTGNVYGIIKEYISSHIQNVDESQIYIMGGSAGGGLAWKLLIAHPDFFSGAVILCSTKVITSSEARTAANIPVWEVSANTDPLVNIAGQSSTWNAICGNSNVKDKCRWSRFSGSVTLPDGSHPGLSHFLAKTIGYDFCLISNGSAIPGMSTSTASGSGVSINYQTGIINWLQSSNSKLESKKAEEAEQKEEPVISTEPVNSEVQLLAAEDTYTEEIENQEPLTEINEPNIETQEPETIKEVESAETETQLSDDVIAVTAAPEEIPKTENEIPVVETTAETTEAFISAYIDTSPK